MKCDYCGYENKPGVKYCAFCGVELILEQEQQRIEPDNRGYKENSERRKEWENIFRTGQQKQMPSQQETLKMTKGKEEKDSLGSRIKRMPFWVKLLLLILLFSEPMMAVFWFLVWLIYDQSRHYHR